MEFIHKPGDIDPNWRNLRDVSVITLKRWFEIHARIKSVDPVSREVALDAPLTEGGIDCDGQFARYWVENVFEVLRLPGEFYHDRAESRLYYIPRFGDRIDTAEVIAPVLDRLVAVEGNPFGEKVSHVWFENLEFRHSEYRYPEGYQGSVQAAHTLPGAITLRGATNCVFYQCTVAQIAQYGIEFRLGCTRNQVVACHLHDLGGGGVKVNHDRGTASIFHEPAVEVSRKPEHGLLVPEGADPGKLPRQKVTISDCLIHDGGKIYPSAVGIWIGDSAGNRIRHNEIWGMHYSGISCGWMWCFQYGVEAADNLIEGNHIHHLNQSGLLSDLAGIYTLGPQPGSRVLGNLIHDVRTANYGNWGLYHDGSSSLFYDEGNALYRCGYGGFFSNVGKNNLLVRNIFINDQSPDNPAFVVGDDSGLLTLTARENLMVSGAPQVLFHTTWIGHVRFERNIYMNPHGTDFGFVQRSFIGKMFSFEEWNQSAFARDERLAKGRVEGLENGTILVSAGAEFLDEKWRGILARLEKTGPRQGASRPGAFADWPQDMDEPRPVVMAVFEWEREMFKQKRKDYYHTYWECFAEGSTPCKLLLVNRGEIPWEGKVFLKAEKPEQVILGGCTEEIVRLEPGEQRTLHFTGQLAPGADSCLIHAQCAGDEAFFPVGIFLHKTRTKDGA
ncbi:right-handed parallel beta-helix repeat-containing protein [Geitlerinema calcuttense]|uniref:Right-handed parallel beta-helix repeat-containing protein n=1 Tax=Geitlerinema calcuttense NRMC-F 0142 TaxID=2922238 RepID=A0ABT7LZP3_9CYAN|nr:right-handed parallel beta-helix repeat-containing protein [Geitlerinema calcuttense]MDL5057475.1 right-handed parallel beta-helix repeat-containing protein [Geitlerinema calcuttense NRMC-F 0142]